MLFRICQKVSEYEQEMPQSLEGSYQSSGNNLNCNIFEYLMMYQFDFTDIIITILYHII